MTSGRIPWPQSMPGTRTNLARHWRLYAKPDYRASVQDLLNVERQFRKDLLQKLAEAGAMHGDEAEPDSIGQVRKAVHDVLTTGRKLGK